MIKIIAPRYMRFRSWLAGRKIGALAVWPGVTVFASKERAENKYLVNHEAIHHAQMREVGTIRLFIMNGRFKKKYTYRLNPFEQEAYENMYDLTYLATREPFAWKKYL
jgi:hypothetical protein